ncbi:MAG: spore coat associated protein CotJA [Clostridiales bacterium]|nr:spore coat associated protein CotJA [Clostridiales bacterium]
MYICDSCRVNGAECSGTTVPAGGVSVGLSVCGYETVRMQLPKLIAVDQNYSSGLCPGCALEKGTMFPELVSEY